ncbi:uncharacterized protein LOC120704978 isoform X2 [Panicum virgatum]|uniref:Uncharacterized protein n=1 Tax=Panicum virgatum TaxID=38727 RepID=A0A8T0TH65_PANVG|nr:uncharacterized protein LOC120704978 isoform X2 [Panicum virgatum]KAG2608958.1 hypothetical protein PVAP13_4KG013243 [Panicum virgatum]
MATRNLVTRTWTPAASTLGRCLGTGMPPPARFQFLHAVPSQDGIAIRRLSYDLESARDMLERAKKQEEVMRRGIKWFSRGVKAAEWACYFCVSTTIAVAVMVGRE